MHTLIVTLGGLVLLGLFLLLARSWGPDRGIMGVAAKAFIPVWLSISLVNLWIGVQYAGYTVLQELPISRGHIRHPCCCGDRCDAALRSTLKRRAWRPKRPGSDLVQVVALLAAGVVAVPIFRRLGLGSVLGYLAAGLVIGPFGLGLFTDPQAILHVAELGVVMFLFIIGLEMQPSRLWACGARSSGSASLQVGVCGALLTVRRHRARLSARASPSSPAPASC